MKEERIDVLNRDQFVDDLFGIINKLSKDKKSCTFAINGDWGCGKSFVLEMLEEKLSECQNEETADNQYMVFHYNCWQYDYYNEPLIAITSALYDDAKAAGDLIPANIKIALLSMLCFISLSAKDLANNAFKGLTTLDVSKLHKKTKERVEAYKSKGKPEDNLISIREAVESTHDALEELADEKTIVIVVDELDRCLPEYAIKVLERLHHLFDGIGNLIVILAVDKEQLEHSVSQIFGIDKTSNDSKIDSYLKKFINFEVELDKGVINEEYKRKYKEYCDLFLDNTSKDFDLDLFYEYLFSQIDIRSVQRIIERTTLIHKLVFDEKVDWEIMCAELIFVTYVYLNGKNYIESTVFGNDLLPKNSGYNKFNFSNSLRIYFKDEVKLGYRIASSQNMFDESERTYYITREGFSEKIALYLTNIFFNTNIQYIVPKSLPSESVLRSNVERIREFQKYNYIIN